MSLNKVILIGNVGREPDVKYFDTDSAVANFTLATNERGYTLSDGTQMPERTDWHNIAVRRRDLVSFVERYVHKGNLVTVEGKIRYREYMKGDIKHFVTEIIAEKVDFFNIVRKTENNNTDTGSKITE
ncbi:MAG: single-stranded DNA-binding protein [Paludibacteraceae bacterium]|jgi:single-strand DNA-binding protein|nr:single-stranded DNA-binding protein [Paludibacteraceae bacterium]